MAPPISFTATPSRLASLSTICHRWFHRLVSRKDGKGKTSGANQPAVQPKWQRLKCSFCGTTISAWQSVPPPSDQPGAPCVCGLECLLQRLSHPLSPSTSRVSSAPTVPDLPLSTASPFEGYAPWLRDDSTLSRQPGLSTPHHLSRTVAASTLSSSSDPRSHDSLQPLPRPSELWGRNNSSQVSVEFPAPPPYTPRA